MTPGTAPGGDESQRPRRPSLRGDMPDLLGDPDPADRIAIAHATASALLRAGRADDASPGTTERLVRLADQVGLDELAELWRESGPGTLPGTMWSLYLLRSWVHRNGPEASRLFAAGQQMAEVSTAVAGVEQPPGPREVAALGDAILTRAFDGDFATTLERASAFCRVIASGRAYVADDALDDERDRQIRLARGNLRMAEELEQAAGLWRRQELH
ncbi:hypothetical protein G1H11_06035 [Phytoactinopolyspora alkaliphila]|uniref:DNA-directed RNA polymerase subunit beta n=1 Tax=Phytoactinopolyspora alkaliphila TaxID=1783498 RepID=A0A6N9YIZ1_9ACTN|nr:hypothetical protein [Phytoactinopolyspora alkaliphila]NED94868.1 hypothetical protein [Phytoactinopolyspora alkaliphila]